MWIISTTQFLDIPSLTEMLIIKEFAQFPDSMAGIVSLPLQGEGRKYGYEVHQMFFGEKKYVFTFRSFQFTPSKPLPEVPELQTRRQAEQYEVLRQGMGYVTALELHLADECIKTGRIEIDSTKPRAYLEAVRTLYGLYWLEYERDCESHDQEVYVKAAIRKCKDQQRRLEKLKGYRLRIARAEELYRLKDAIEKKQYELPNFVKYYLRSQGNSYEQIKEGNQEKFPNAHKLSKKIDKVSFLTSIIQLFRKDQSSKWKNTSNTDLEENARLTEGDIYWPQEIQSMFGREKKKRFDQDSRSRNTHIGQI